MCRRARRARSGDWRRDLQPDREGQNHPDRRHRGAGDPRRLAGLHPREHPAPRARRQELPRRHRPSGIAVSTAPRRPDPLQRSADWPGGRRDARARASRRLAGRDRIRDRGPRDRSRGAARRRLRTDEARDHRSTARPARRSRPGARPGRGEDRGPVSPAGRASQPDGPVRDDGGARRGRHPHRSRQDAGSPERPELPLPHLRLLEGRASRPLSVRRRRVRIGPAPAIPGLPRGAGGATAQAIGPRHAHARADVHPRTPPHRPSARRPRRAAQWHARRDHPR